MTFCLENLLLQARDLGILSDDEFEDIVTEWIFEYLKSKYTSIRRCGGAGDKGRDIIAWIDEKGGKWITISASIMGVN